MSLDNQIKMDVIELEVNKKFITVGKFPMIVSYSRIAPMNREIHELEESATPVDVFYADFSGMNMDFPRTIVIQDTSGGDNEGAVVILTGMDARGRPITETLTMDNTGEVSSKNAFQFLSRIQAVEVPANTLSVCLGNAWGFGIDLGYIQFLGMSQSDGNNSSQGQFHPADEVGEGPIFVVDNDYDTVLITTDLISNNGTHLTFFFV